METRPLVVISKRHADPLISRRRGGELSAARHPSHVLAQQELMEHLTVGAQHGVVKFGIGERGESPRRVGVAPERVPQLDWHLGGIGEGLHGLDASNCRARDDAPHLVLHQQSTPCRLLGVHQSDRVDARGPGRATTSCHVQARGARSSTAPLPTLGTTARDPIHPFPTHQCPILPQPFGQRKVPMRHNSRPHGVHCLAGDAHAQASFNQPWSADESDRLARPADRPRPASAARRVAGSPCSIDRASSVTSANSGSTTSRADSGIDGNIALSKHWRRSRSVSASAAPIAETKVSSSAMRS